MLKLLKYLKGFAVAAAIIAPLMMALEVTMDLMQPKLMADIIDIGVANGNTRYILMTGVKMVIAALLGFIGGAGCSIFASIAAMNMGEKLRQGLFDKIQTLSFLELDKLKTSSLITRLTNDVVQVQNMMLMALRIMVRSPLLCLGGLTMAIALSPKLSLVFLVALPIIITAVILILNRSFPLFLSVQQKIDKVNVVMRESILGVRVIKAFTIEDKQSEKFDDANNDLMNRSIEGQNVNMLLWPIVTLVMNLSVIGVLWFGGKMFFNHTLEIGRIMAFINYLLQIMNSLIMVVMVVLNFSRAKASADRINEVFDTEASIKETGNSSDMNGYDVEFKNVSFRYNEHSEYVLQDISFTAEEGKKVGIIGATGSGKSSFVNLIPRLYDVNEGQVFVGGIDVKKLKLKQLRDNIGVVLQDSILFSGNIEGNLKFGNPDANCRDMEEAARDAEAAEFINAKEDTYKSVVEQRGRNLSGGQKQRLSIARTLLRNPKILIMDDSTSALDMATEARLQNSLKSRMAGKTVLIIAQRISAVMDSDKIIVLDNGRIAAIGNHKTLLKENEIYRNIALSQLGEEVLLNG
jgi:ATP-binding cassette subfamily B protein